MGKKILVLTGSPREGGNTDQLADAFIRGAMEAGNQVYRFDAGRKQVEQCVGCETCASTGMCAVYDDFTELADYMRTADGIAIFTPLYWYSWPAKLKAAIDRFYCFFCSKKYTNIKQSILVVCAGDTKMHIFDPIIGAYEKTAKLLKWENKGHLVIPGVMQAGEVQNTPAISGMEKIGRYF